MAVHSEYANGRLLVSAIFNAPRELVFDAWTDPAKVEKWWGCRNTTKVVSTVEPRLGGRYMNVMTVTNAGEIPMGGVITEWDPPAKLAFRIGDEGADNSMLVSVSFFERAGGTEVQLVQTNLPADFSLSVQDGWGNSFRKLGEFLEPVLAG